MGSFKEAFDEKGKKDPEKQAEALEKLALFFLEAKAEKI